jgi:Uma2 family endonuclease
VITVTHVDRKLCAERPTVGSASWWRQSWKVGLIPAMLALEIVGLFQKRGDYAEGRVPEYWIVNPQTETTAVLHLSGDAYDEAGNYRRGGNAASVLLAGFSIAASAVFDAT